MFFGSFVSLIIVLKEIYEQQKEIASMIGRLVTWGDYLQGWFTCIHLLIDKLKRKTIW